MRGYSPTAPRKVKALFVYFFTKSAAPGRGVKTRRRKRLAHRFRVVLRKYG